MVMLLAIWALMALHTIDERPVPAAPPVRAEPRLMDAEEARAEVRRLRAIRDRLQAAEPPPPRDPRRGGAIDEAGGDEHSPPDQIPHWCGIWR